MLEFSAPIISEDQGPLLGLVPRVIGRGMVAGASFHTAVFFAGAEVAAIPAFRALRLFVVQVHFPFSSWDFETIPKRWPVGIPRDLKKSSQCLFMIQIPLMGLCLCPHFVWCWVVFLFMVSFQKAPGRGRFVAP